MKLNPHKPLPPVKKLKKKLWELCRSITKKRYEHHCYTCPQRNLIGSNCHLGHFIPSSICSTAMRYDLDNLRLQCYACNIHKSGNWPAFEAHLIQERGEDRVSELKKRNRETIGFKYDALWYLRKIEEYEKL